MHMKKHLYYDCHFVQVVDYIHKIARSSKWASLCRPGGGTSMALKPPVWWNILYWGSRRIFHTVCWCATGCEWGTTFVNFGITYVCFDPIILPLLAMGPSTNIYYFCLCQKCHLKDKSKIFENFHVGLMGFVEQLLVKLEMSSIWGFLQLSLCCPLAVTYANMLVATLWPLRHAPHLQSCVWYRVLEAPWSHLRYAKIFCIRYLDAFLSETSFAFWFQFLRFLFTKLTQVRWRHVTS